MAATAQVNVRMDARMKGAGDAGLTAAGITPSEAVRALWRLAADYIGDPTRLRRVLFPGTVGESSHGEELARRRELLTAGSSLARNAFERSHVAWPSAPMGSDDELKRLAYVERHGEGLGWDG